MRITTSRSLRMLIWLSMSMMLVLGTLGIAGTALAESIDKQRIFDEAGLLSANEVQELEAYAAEVSARWSTDVLVYTTDNVSGTDVVLLTQQFYDDRAPGYDKPHGNTAILTLDMYNRELYLAGFYKAETYLNDRRLDQINDAVTSSLSGGAYRQAFDTYMDMVDRFMAVEPSAEEYESGSGGSGYVSPEQEYANKLLREGVQIVAALAIAGVAVFIMVRNAGGKVTVNRKTYEDPAQMAIRGQVDQYSHTTVTRTKIERNSGGRGGGGGGGITRGGHSHSGSRGKF